MVTICRDKINASKQHLFKKSFFQIFSQKYRKLDYLMTYEVVNTPKMVRTDVDGIGK